MVCVCGLVWLSGYVKRLHGRQCGDTYSQESMYDCRRASRQRYVVARTTATSGIIVRNVIAA